MYSYLELAKMIDYSLLNPRITDAETSEGCRLAMSYHVASVCAKPYAMRTVADLLRGSDVKAGCAIGFPHGNSSTGVKRYETEAACRDGAEEIDMVINVGKALGGDWAYVAADIKAVCDEAHMRGATVKVILEMDFLGDGGAGLGGDDLKRKLCQVSESAGADWVKTSTGFGFVRGGDGRYSYKGATEHDLMLMRAACSPKVGIKAAGGVRTLDALIRVRELGCSRCGVSAVAAVLDEQLRREAAAKANPVVGSVSGPSRGQGGM